MFPAMSLERLLDSLGFPDILYNLPEEELSSSFFFPLTALPLVTGAFFGCSFISSSLSDSSLSDPSDPAFLPLTEPFNFAFLAGVPLLLLYPSSLNLRLLKLFTSSGSLGELGA